MFPRRGWRPGFVITLDKEGAGNAGCTLHPRSRVQIAHNKTHTSIQVQRRQSDIPCAMVLRLMPRSPRRRIRLVTVTAGLMADPTRLDRARHRQLDTSNGCQDHTVLPYATTRLRQPPSSGDGLRRVKRLRRAWRRSSCAPFVAHESRSPCDHLARRRGCVHHIPPRVHDDRDTPLLSERDSAE